MARNKPALTLQQMCEKLVEVCDDRYDAADKANCSYTSFSNYLRGARTCPSPLQVPGLKKAFIKYLQPTVTKKMIELAIHLGKVNKMEEPFIYSHLNEILSHSYKSSKESEPVFVNTVFARGEIMSEVIDDLEEMLSTGNEKIERLRRFAKHHE